MNRGISTERWQVVQELFLKLADLGAAQREAELVLVEREDPDLAAQVRRMVAFDARDSTSLDHHGSGLELLKHAGASQQVGGEQAAGQSRGAGIPEQIGAFKVIRVIGAGTSGVVLEAMQSSPERRVAIKLLHPGFASAETQRRFRREGEVLARLTHRGVARVIMAGVLPPPDGRPYIVLEYIEGKSLLLSAAETGWSLAERLRVMAMVCSAVQYAHSRGVIHRDLKPENILVTPAGEPKVLDFGIARLVGGTGHGAMSATLPGQVLGTAAYMSPEQAGGASGQSGADGIDTRTDVYALGAITYHLISGQAAIETADRPLSEVLASVHRGDVPLLGSISPAAKGDIEAVVHRAMARDRRDRYASASELEAELIRAADGEPVLARPPSAARQLFRLAWAHPRTMAAAAIVFAASVAGVVMLEQTRAHAEENFNVASSAADVLLNQVMDRLGPMADTLETRRRIVADLQIPIERFAAARPEDPRLRFNLARLLDARGDLAAYDLDWAESLALRREATEILERLCESERVEKRWQALRSLVLVKSGDILKSTDRLETAIELYERAKVIDEQLVRDAPEDVTLNDQLFWSYQRLADNLSLTDSDRAEEYFELQISQAERLLSISPDRPGSLFAMLTVLAQNASREPLADEQSPQAAREAFAERLRMGQRLVLLSPTNRGHVLRYCGDLMAAAGAYAQAGLHEEAMAMWEQARARVAPLYRSDLGDLAVVDYAAAVELTGAELAAERGDVEGHLKHLQEAVAIRRRALAAGESPSVERAPILCQSLDLLARELVKAGRHAEAHSAFDELVETAGRYWCKVQSPMFVYDFVVVARQSAFLLPDGSDIVLDMVAKIEAAMPGSPVPMIMQAERLNLMGDTAGARGMWGAARDCGGVCGRYAAGRLEHFAARGSDRSE